MALSPATYRFTVKDYHRMAEADILPAQGVELLDGEVMYVGSNAKKYRFTADEFDRMAEAGVSTPRAASSCSTGRSSR